MKLFQAIIIIFVFIILRFVTKKLLGDHYYSNVGDAVGDIFTIGVTILITIKYFSKKAIDFFPTKPGNNKDLALLISTTLSLFIITRVMVELESLLREGSDNYFDAQFIFGWSDDMKNYFIGALLVGPIFEQLFVNGVLLQGLRKNYSISVSIISVVLIFTSFHISVNETNFLLMNKVSVGLFGAFSSWVLVKTSNIKISIYLHFFWNLMNYAFPVLVSLTQLDLTRPFVFLLFSITAIVVCSLLLLRNSHRLASNRFFEFPKPTSNQFTK